MKYVLFVCTQNAGRSQMAQAFFERYAPEDIRAESAGLEPAGQIHPTVVEAMKEIGIDISDRQPKKLTVEMQLHADLAVTLGCGGRCSYVPAHIEDWDLPDPAGRSLEEVRAIRDEIGGLVDDLVLHRAKEIRADRTAHELRLQKVLPALIAEFEGMRTAQEIRECADAVLDSFDDARIRSHVATLAERRTRDCLRANHCYELEDAR
jgi:protein-tyrosine-phosphatase